ncbi:hypothetical protein CYMTET_22910 [Cymbomonas tetramitiformis]|uniref:Uncharacterized protein n=1 Tax=Cymbomonas tetramitiformis TaxID=36881 RepID=A0AAE0L1R2_9CHLO|nr:hypothetical protein CYMTET_22910 [Cymbomonas tetramitiformis]
MSHNTARTSLTARHVSLPHGTGSTNGKTLPHFLLHSTARPSLTSWHLAALFTLLPPLALELGVLPAVAGDVGLVSDKVSKLLWAAGVSRLLAIVPAVVFADMFGRTGALSAASVLTTVAAVAGFSFSYAGLLLSAVFCGLAMAFGIVACLLHVGDVGTEANVGQTLAPFVALQSAVPVIGPALAAFLGQVLGMRGTLAIVAVVSLTTSVLGKNFAPETQEKNTAEMPVEKWSVQFKKAWRDPNVSLLLWTTFVFSSLFYGVVVKVLPTTCTYDCNYLMDPTKLGLGWAGVTLAQALVAPVAGYAGDQIGHAPHILISGFLLNFGMFFVGSATTPAVAIGLGTVCSVGFGIALVSCAAQILSVAPPTSMSKCVGLFLLVVDAGSVLGPMLGNLYNNYDHGPMVAGPKSAHNDGSQTFYTSFEKSELDRNMAKYLEVRSRCVWKNVSVSERMDKGDFTCYQKWLSKEIYNSDDTGAANVFVCDKEVAEKRKEYAEGLYYLDCEEPEDPADPNSDIWRFQRTGLYHSNGGSDWHTVLYNNPANMKEALEADPYLHITASMIAAVSVEGEILDYPPIHNHHTHVYDDHGMPMFPEQFERHGDSGCQESQGGVACLLETFPEGYGVKARPWARQCSGEFLIFDRFRKVMKGGVAAGLLLNKLGGPVMEAMQRAAESTVDLKKSADRVTQMLSVPEYWSLLSKMGGLARGVLDRNVTVGFGVCLQLYQQWLREERDSGNYTRIELESTEIVRQMKLRFSLAGLDRVARFFLDGSFGVLYLIVKHKDETLCEKRRPVVPCFNSPDRMLQNRVGRALCFLIDQVVGHVNVSATQEITGRLARFSNVLEDGDTVMAAGFDVKEMYVRLKPSVVLTAVEYVVQLAMRGQRGVLVKTRGRRGVNWYTAGTPRRVAVQMTAAQILAGVRFILENGYLFVAGCLVRQVCGIGIGGGASPGLAQCVCVYGEMEWTKTLGADNRLSVEQTSEGLSWVFCGMQLTVGVGGVDTRMTMKNVLAGVTAGEQLLFFPFVAFHSECGHVQKMASTLNALYRVERHCSNDGLKAAAVVDVLRELRMLNMTASHLDVPGSWELPSLLGTKRSLLRGKMTTSSASCSSSLNQDSPGQYGATKVAAMFSPLILWVT